MRTPLVLALVLLVATGSAAGEGSERFGLPVDADLRERPGIADALVRGLADGASPRLIVEARVLEVPAEDAPRRQKDLVTALPAEVARRLLQGLAGGSTKQLHHFTSLRLAAGQAATFRASAATADLQDYELETHDQKLEPIVGALEEGVLIQITPGADSHLAVSVDWASVVRPIPTFDTTLAMGQQAVRIQLPELRIGRAQGRAPAAPGEWILAHGGPHAPAQSEGHVALVLLHVRHARR